MTHVQEALSGSLPASAAWALASLFAVFVVHAHAAAGLQAQEADAPPIEYEISGRVSAEGRWFPQEGAFDGQKSLAAGFVTALRLDLENVVGQSVAVAPFFRYDHSDPHRTHFDLHEAYLLMFGDVGASGWELRIGADQVFWGVTESQRLVDIVNQIDFVEHPTGEAKLGQPMVHATWFGDWGAFEVFGMPYHRARTFQGREGRLRLQFVVDEERIEYERGAGPWHLDLAARYSHSLGLLDLGLSVFDGLSREPFLVPVGNPDGVLALLQHYEQIRQFGLDAQVTFGSWLLKLEAIQRAGARNLSGVQEDYFAAVVGGEYAFYSVAGSAADLSLLGEWNYDGRGRSATPSRSPDTLENDLFFAARLALNDVHSTAITAGLFTDVSRATRTLALEFDRRLLGEWSLRAEVVTLLSVDPADLHYLMRNDSFLDLSLTYNF